MIKRIKSALGQMPGVSGVSSLLVNNINEPLLPIDEIKNDDINRVRSMGNTERTEE